MLGEREGLCQARRLHAARRRVRDRAMVGLIKKSSVQKVWGPYIVHGNTRTILILVLVLPGAAYATLPSG
jgi:hypothetical protein